MVFKNDRQAVVCFYVGGGIKCLVQKKSPDRFSSIRGFPFFIPQNRCQAHDPRTPGSCFARAGFLTLGSSLLPRLPITIACYSGFMRSRSPITAAGPFPIFTGFPCRLC
jgi:hypothetical protein